MRPTTAHRSLLMNVGLNVTQIVFILHRCLLEDTSKKGNVFSFWCHTIRQKQYLILLGFGRQCTSMLYKHFNSKSAAAQGIILFILLSRVMGEW